MFSATRTASAASLAARRAFSTAARRDVVILSAVRTPIGSYMGSLKDVSATHLGSIAVREAIKRAGIDAKDVSEAFLGNVVSSNLGQAPAHQATVNAGVPWEVASTQVNKVCASGTKSIMMAAQSIMSGHNKCVVAGGFESMSQIPHYLPKARSGVGFGHVQLLDGVMKDGLTDAFDDHAMGICAEACAEKYGITREDQDAFAVESYRRAAEASAAGKFKEEIVPVEIKGRKGTVTVSEDEEFGRLKPEKVPTLRPAFTKSGTVTAANASSMNDGAAALIVADAEWAAERGLTPMARIRGFADAGRPAIEFTIAPADALPKAFADAGIEQAAVDLYEINEAFSVVALANNELLGLDAEKVNVNGGAVALGHPIGASGARICVTLLHALAQNNASIGAAAICNGGGGASAIVFERCE